MKIIAATEIDAVISSFMQFEEQLSIATSSIMEPIERGEVVGSEEALYDMGVETKKAGSHLTYDQQAVMGTIFYALYRQDVDIMKTVPQWYVYEIAERAKIISTQSLRDNRFLKTIHLTPGVKGRFEVVQNRYKPYEVFPYDQPCIEKIHAFPKLAMCKEPCPFITIRDTATGQNWISLTPCEMNAVKPQLSEPHSGKALVLGCGVGYYPFMLSEKNTVQQVTIVEKDTDVVDFFKTYILPQMPNKSKVEIINQDPFEYLSVLGDGMFQTCFVSLWRGSYDYEPYIRARLTCRKFSQTKCSFWIEPIMLRMLSGFIIQILQIYRNGGEGIYKKAYNKAPENVKFVLKFLMQKLEGIDFRSGAQLETYLNPVNLSVLLF